METKRPYTRPETFFFLGLLLIVSVLAFFVFLPFLSTLVISATIATLVYPYYKKLIPFCRGNRLVATFLFLLLLVIIIIIPVYFIVLKIIQESSSAIAQINGGGNYSLVLSGFEDNIRSKLNVFFPGVDINIHQYLTQVSAWALGLIEGLFFSSFGIGLRFFLGIFSLFYFLKDGKIFLDFLRNLSPIPAEHTEVIFRKLRLAIRAILGGSFIIAIIQGLVSGIGFTIFGLPNPALWGSLTALASFLPGVGTAVIIVPAIVYLIALKSLGAGIGLAIWAGTSFALIDNYLSPRIIGRGLKIHPLIVLFSIIGGVTFFGPEGFILGPLTMSLLFALFDVYHVMISDSKAEAKEHSLL